MIISIIMPICSNVAFIIIIVFLLLLGFIITILLSLWCVIIVFIIITMTIPIQLDLQSLASPGPFLQSGPACVNWPGQI